MRYVRSTALAVLAFLVASASSPFWVHAQQKDPEMTVRIGKVAWTYTREQLLAMATMTLLNRKGNREKPAVLLPTVLFKDTGLSPEKLHMVFLMSNIVGSKIIILRGNDLAYVDRLVLASGPDKGDKRHQWALVPKDEASYRAVAPLFGSERKRGIYRIDIVPKADAKGR